MIGRGLASAALVLLLVPACGSGSEEASPPPSATAPAAAPAPAAPTGAGAQAVEAEAKQIFESRCVTCHGASGSGDGPASAGLDPRPRDFQDPEWQRSVTDEHIENIVRYGGAAVGRSPAMPANPDLTSKPDVVAALRAHVRGLGR